MLFFIYRERQSRTRAENKESRAEQSQSTEKVYHNQRTFVFLPHQVEKGRSKEAQLKAVESNEKIYPYQRTFVFLPHQVEKEQNNKRVYHNRTKRVHPKAYKQKGFSV